MSRRRNALTAGAILFGFVIVAVVLVQLRPDPFLPPPPPRTPFVTTVPAEARSGPIPVYGAGTVRPWAQIDVAPQVNGKVSWVEPAFQSGGRIRGGQVLFRIDDADYINRVRQASANVAAQQVALLQAGEEARIAKAEYERFRIRRTGNTVPPDASPLTLREPQLAAARAALARDSAILADAELALSRTQVRAPFSGVVRGESVDLGRFVAAGQGVGRIYADDAVEVVVPLSDADAGLIPGLWQLRAGDGDSRVRARVTARYGESGYAWEGYVDRAEAALDEQTRTIGVVVRVPDPFAGGVPEAHPAGRHRRRPPAPRRTVCGRADRRHRAGAVLRRPPPRSPSWRRSVAAARRLARHNCACPSPAAFAQLGVCRRGAGGGASRRCRRHCCRNRRHAGAAGI